MAPDRVVFKGDRHGVSIHLDEEADFDQLLRELRQKLSPARQFFTGAIVRIYAGARSLQPEQRSELEQTVQEFGLCLSPTSFAEAAPTPPRRASCASKRAERPEEGEEVGERTILIRRTLRSGQKLDFHGNVVVMGDVNPGAEIVCTGDIVVLGALRGMAHAGAAGNAAATVFAFRLEPTQLRIAGYISRAPDEKVPHPQGPEIAIVKDDLIQVMAYRP